MYFRVHWLRFVKPGDQGDRTGKENGHFREIADAAFSFALDKQVRGKKI
jgi:hypothetical protein